MKILKASPFVLFAALAGCSGDTAKKYVFDTDELKENL